MCEAKKKRLSVTLVRCLPRGPALERLEILCYTLMLKVGDGPGKKGLSSNE